MPILDKNEVTNQQQQREKGCTPKHIKKTKATNKRKKQQNK